MAEKRLPVCNDEYVIQFDVRPLGIDGTLPRSYVKESELHLLDLGLPKDSFTGEDVAGEWHIQSSSIGSDVSVFIPMHSLDVRVGITFFPEDSSSYRQCDSVLDIKLKNVERKLFFSGTRGLWFL